MTSITDTVHESLAKHGYSQYSTYARPVIEDLTKREGEMSNALVAFAVEQGLDEEDAAMAIRRVGMFIPEPERPEPGTLASAEAANADPNDLAAVLGRINSTLDSLGQFARANGWRG
jgi:hypothetical protein